jgi:hypothetical protein
MPELTSRLESHGQSSKADISAHGAAFDDLGIDIARIESSDTDQNYLISSAWQILDKFSKAESRFVYGGGDQPPSIELHKVLSAMLSHAQDCGGQEGLRYIASAIVACRERSQCNGGDLVELKLLESLAITMITQFLFICAFFLFCATSTLIFLKLKRGGWRPRIGSAQPLTNMIPDTTSASSATHLRVKRGFD